LGILAGGARTCGFVSPPGKAPLADDRFSARVGRRGREWLVFVFFHPWKRMGPWPGRLIGCLFLLGLFQHVWRFDYPETLRRLSPEMAWGSTSSVEAATLINTRVPRGELFAVSPMYYWDDYGHLACPILLVALDRIPDSIARSPKTAGELASLLQEHEIKWFLYSPPPGIANEIMTPFLEKNHLKIHQGQGALLLEVLPSFFDEPLPSQQPIPPNGDL
jgi:hypothetical protein